MLMEEDVIIIRRSKDQYSAATTHPSRGVPSPRTAPKAVAELCLVIHLIHPPPISGAEQPTEFLRLWLSFSNFWKSSPLWVQPPTFFGSLYCLWGSFLRGYTQKSEPLYGCTTSRPNIVTLTPWDLVNKMEPIFLLHFIKRPPTYMHICALNLIHSFCI